MGDGVFNTRKLWRELRERGYTGGLTRVIAYVQPHRQARAEAAVSALRRNRDNKLK